MDGTYYIYREGWFSMETYQSVGTVDIEISGPEESDEKIVVHSVGIALAALCSTTNNFFN